MSAVYRREMSAFFTSPMAYIYFGVFCFFSGIFLTQTSLTRNTTSMSMVFTNMFVIIIFLIPVLTMKLFSEEKKQRTDQGLLTAPVSITGIVMGKYLAALSVFSLANVIFIIYGIIFSIYSSFSWSVLLGNILGVLLVGTALISIGIFVSSLTENQLIAAIGGIVINLLLYMIDVFAQTVSSAALGSILLRFSLYKKYSNFASGMLDINSIVFFISIAAVFNFLTIKVLERRRWN